MSDQTNTDNTNNIFINGRSQIIEMLKIMPLEEKQKLLHHIRVKNPLVAQELTENSISFSNLENLNKQYIELLSRNVPASILGIALKSSPMSFQRKVLSSVKREYAVTAFKYMRTPLKNEISDCKRAQNKVIGILSKLMRNQLIRL